jgi:hypothetical protein
MCVAMALVRCTQGHYYDNAQDSSCPHCALPGIALAHPGGTVPVRNLSPHAADVSDTPGGTFRVGDDPPDDSGGRTVGVVQQTLGIDPVVGWLVCVDGADRGRDYRIRAGRNFLGRGDHMHICIRGDSSISRDKHAILSYDPRHHAFRLAPGDSTGLTYRNGEPVDMPVTLNARDVIEVGRSRLLFVPFCGPNFQWTAVELAPEP